jgi:hypothetical protein
MSFSGASQPDHRPPSAEKLGDSAGLAWLDIVKRAPGAKADDSLVTLIPLKEHGLGRLRPHHW